MAWAEPQPEPLILAVLASGEEELARQKDSTPVPRTGGALTEEELDRLLDLADDNLTPEQKQHLRAFLEKNQDVFQASLAPPGAAFTIPHQIDTQGHAPIKRRRY
jgi:hypothetical protein